MGDKSPPKEPKQQTRSGKGFTYEVVLLDGEHVNIELDKNADGKDLFDKVCQHLDLSERDYFGLQYVDERIPHPLKCWLSPEKKISKQKKRGPWLFDFALKFYPPDPTQLRESLTRWLVVLQTRRDILNGKLPATFLTQAMLGSYCVQADIGDYDSSEHKGIDYIRDIPFVPNQTTELLDKIVELHRQHKGQTPDEAEINYLENAKKLSMYGVDLHAAQDVNNVDIMIGVCASGLQVYRDKLRISRFVWPKILKISYKRNHFYIKVRPIDNSRMENSVSFKLASHRLAKRLWKICVEHHAFFRLREADQPNNAALFPRLGSKFRYSGRTLYQARHSSQTLDRPDPYFERSQPARSTYAAPSNRSRSVDELANRPDFFKDDLDAEVKRRPSEGREGRDKRDHMGQPTVISMLGLPEGMKPVENEEGRELEPGANRSRDGRDRHDLKPGEEDTTLQREGTPGTMGLTPAELQKKAKEDDKERKKREKEEEKKRKKEEEEKKKAAKKGKGKGATDPTAEDRTDHLAGGDTTERAPGRTSGTFADPEGEPVRFDVMAPVGFAPGEKGKGKDKDKGGRSPGHDSGDKDRWSPHKDGTEPYSAHWEPGVVPEVEMRHRSAPGTKEPDSDDENKERFSTFKDPGGNERWSFNKERPKSGQDARSPGGRDKDGRSPGRDGDDRDRFSPGKDGDGRDRFAPGRDGDRWSPGRGDQGRFFPEGDRREPYYPGREGENRDRYAPGYAPGVYEREPFSPGREGDRASWEPGRQVRSPYAPYGERDGREPGEDGRRGPGEDGRRGPGEDGRRGPGEDGRRGPGEDGRRGPGEDGRNGERSPGRGGDDGRYFGPGDSPTERERDRWGPGVVPLDFDRKDRKDSDEEDDKDGKKKDRKDSDKDSDKDKKKKKGRKDSDKDDDKDKKKKKGRKDSDKEDDKDKKKKKKGSKDADKDDEKDDDKEDEKDKKKKKDRKDSDKDDDKKKKKDADKDEKDGKKDKKKGKKDKDRKGSDKDDDKAKGADKDGDKDHEKDKKKDKDADKPIKEEKRGGLFSKFKKPKDSKTKLPEEEDHSRPGHGPEDYGPGGYGPGGRDPEGRGTGGYGPGGRDPEGRSPGGYGPGGRDPEGYGPGGYGPGGRDSGGYGPGGYGPGGRDPEGYGPGGYGPGGRDPEGYGPGGYGPGGRDPEGRRPGGYGPGGYGPGGYGPGDQDPRTQMYPDRADVARNQPGKKEEKEKSKRASLIASLCPGLAPNKKENRKSSASSEEGVFDPTGRVSKGPSSDQGGAYPGARPGYAPGMGVGSGDLSGIVGEEKWIDNKMTFQPIVLPKKESKESLKSPQRLSGIDHTMPFFSPAATSTVGRPRSGKVPPPISPKPTNTSFDDSFSRRDPPTVATESVQYQPDLEEVPVPTKNVPLVKTETRTVTYEREGFPFDSEEDGVLVSASSHSTRMQTIETTTYKTEKDGVQETRVEHRVVLSSNDDDFDYDAALAEAIRSVTEFNPDMSVERIECVQQIEEVKDK